MISFLPDKLTIPITKRGAPTWLISPNIAPILTHNLGSIESPLTGELSPPCAISRRECHRG